MTRQKMAVVCMVLAALPLALAWGEAATSAPAPATASAPATIPAEVRLFEVVEVSLTSGEDLDNPFWDAAMTATFTGPDGRAVTVEGFYDGAQDYRVRFVPRQEGPWTYKAALTGPGISRETSGRFVCRGRAGDGFLRLSTRNRYRMEYETGRPFYPIGIQTCGAINNVDFDGPDADGKWRSVPVEQWCEAFRGAVNLVRVNLSSGTRIGCSVSLIGEAERPDRYDLEAAALLDRMYRLHRAAGFSQICILFQDMSPYGKHTHAFGMVRDLRDFKNLRAANLPLQDKYIRYLVARYAAFVDIWELFNEDSYAPDDYLAHLHKVVRDADPYDHIITSNFSRPEKDFCEIIAPHEYVAIPANATDAHLTKQMAAMKSFGKVVQYTEFGNKGTMSNVDPVKWRLAAWTAFMNECGMLYWSMSGTKTVGKPNATGNSNTYMGPDTRQHFRVLAEFTRDLPIDLRPRFSSDSPEFQFRSYALGNDRVSVLYLHHYVDYDTPSAPTTYRVETGPGWFRIRWISPEDGKPLVEETTGYTAHQFLTVAVPPIRVDAACRIDRLAAPPEAPAGPVPPAAEGPALERPKEWTQAWKADFADARAAQDWMAIDGFLRVANGRWTLLAAPESEGEALLRSRLFPGSVRLECTAWLAGASVADLDVILNAGPKGYADGYLFQFGGKGNTVTRLVRAGRAVEETAANKTLVQPGKSHRIVAENDGGKLRLLVDGAEVFRYTDPEPLAGKGHGRIGFYVWAGTLSIQDLAVYVKD